ncbi:hypothetical protein [Methylobacterium nigriterrae]|uniref:hypothetical protein n=1 Tax=Methylobacterium nigriterrae TaxID=3127512 RepID=UPI003013EBEE
MRTTQLVFLLMTLCVTRMASAAEAPTADLAALQHEWHRCVRNAFSGRPESVSTRAAERTALAACKAGEDAYVAAVMASRAAENEAARRADRTLTSRARAWAASVLSYVIDPVSSWLGAPAR